MATRPTADFAVALKDETSGAAKRAAGSLEDLKKKIYADTKALREMQAAMRRLKGATTPNVATMSQLKDKITAQKQVLAQAQSSYLKLGGTFEAAGGKARQASGGLAELLTKAQGLPGPLGAAAGRITSLINPATLLATALVAVVGAMTAVVAAAASATVALARYGVSQSNARRTELLRLEGLTTLRRWYGLAAGSATAMQSAIDRVSDTTALGRGQLEQYTNQLYRMGLRGEQLNQALEGMALAGSVQGERGARRFAGMAAGIARTGGEVRRLTESFQARLGPIARRQLLGLDVQTRRLHQNLERIFSGLRLEAFLGGLQSMLMVFSQTTVSGRALKSIVESLFQPLIDFVGGPVFSALRVFFLGMVFGALKVENAILRLRLALRETFGRSVLPDINLGLVFEIGAVAAMGLAAAIAFSAAALVGLAGAVAVFVSPLLAAVAAVVALGTAIGVHMAPALNRLRNLDFAGIGRSMIDGLINGIRNGIGRVTGTVNDLASRVRSTFVGAMQIGSPSRVFAELGEQLSAGLSIGIDSGAGDVADSVGNLVNVPGAGGAGGGATSISIGDVHIHTDAEDPEGMARSFVDELSDLLAGVGITVGASEPEPEGAT